ncbi:uncharacterized protein LACBIDRAFT_299543 [Laccaria bicolor S238N-H82]|uniref:Predicted protein n=1 Tax=Laccaria bicolor (strain S238N-H82 / ATCC MYA-4686) TaxID=486041 RepID=B0E3S2_LACBS|nr:uncharacterized protein LACBIDRAFT_299543 [Laccaria bicolor S238N-H82]EDQ98509.1 predicted protein [Laccaria bicolor S238N-H82]|eukprot:XP_001890839.1 predicted protein [Laccaria bicolor S238N-H82]
MGADSLSIQSTTIYPDALLRVLLPMLECLVSSPMPRPMTARIIGRYRQNDVISLGRLDLHAPYRPLVPNSRMQGICPPSRCHPPRHSSQSRLGYTQAPRSRSHHRNSSHTTTTDGEQLHLSSTPVEKTHILAVSMVSGYIAGVALISQESDVRSKGFQLVMTTAHLACLCRLSR